MPKRPCSFAILRVATVLCACTTLFGQVNRGSIRGVVHDSSSATVAGAHVECKNVGTSLTVQSISSKEGEYVFPALMPGDYQINVEAAGFRRAASEIVRVYVGEITRVDIQLQVGTVEESIQVSGSAALVQPDSAAATTVLTAAEYDHLPLAAVSRLRIPTDFALLTPGVLGGQQRPGKSQTATTSISIDGSGDGTVDVLVDGMSAGQISSFGSFTEVAVPVDAIQEFNVVKGAFSAEYGYVRTGLINFSLKSGTNELHGSVFENLRNQNLNARAFFEQDKLPFHQNNFGGTFSGPVVIPRVYNGKDRTFFMFSSDNSLFRGTSQVVLYTSPTEAMLRGDFSGLRTATGQPRLIYDPATTTSDGKGGFTRQPFSGNIIPAARIDPIAAQVAALYPKPPSPAPDSNFLGRGGATFLNDYSYNTKVDHRITNQHTLSVSVNHTRIPRITNSNPYENSPLWNGLNQVFSSNEVRVTYNAIFTPTTLNTFQFGVNRWVNNVRTLSYGQDWPNKLGLKGVGGDGSLPVFAFSSDNYPQISSTRWDANVEQNVQFRNTTTLIRGRHTFKLGFETRNQQVKTRNWQNQNGTFSFSFLQTALNASSQSGNAFASFLLGYVNQGSISTPLHVASIRPYYAGFVQDDWKISPRFTLNLGLRYDLDLAPHEQYDRASIFDLDTPNPSAGNLPGALVFLGSGPGRIGRSTYEEVHKANFAPRVGLAYQVNRLTVLRAGYGLSYAGNGLLNSSLGFNTTANFQSQ
ncbi:MAG TPA: TonB-dependent receptor, partial [Bryobacteraceae bacterium]|nr:TonB-dependent receptor [Bryobacteraceae bacterium]